jgi:hemerythrin
MQWSESLSVGNAVIDNQHKELFDRINDLVAAIKQKTCKYKIGDVIKFLDDYIIFFSFFFPFIPFIITPPAYDIFY